MALIFIYLVVFFQVLSVTFAEDVQYHYGVNAIPVVKDGRISGMQDHKDKDIILGGLFKVHYDRANTSNDGVCGQVIWDHGIQMLEAMLYAINSDPDLLPNLTLGFDIGDTCKRENVAQDEANDFVFSNGQLELENCHSLIVSNLFPCYRTYQQVPQVALRPMTYVVALLSYNISINNKIFRCLAKYFIFKILYNVIKCQ